VSSGTFDLDLITKDGLASIILGACKRDSDLALVLEDLGAGHLGGRVVTSILKSGGLTDSTLGTSKGCKGEITGSSVAWKLHYESRIIAFGYQLQALS